MKHKTLIGMLSMIFLFLFVYCSNPSTETEIENTAPTASFLITPHSDDTTTVFTIDATNSSNKEDSAYDRQFLLFNLRLCL